MKKLLPIILIFALLFTATVTVDAASMSNGGGSQLAVGETTTVTFYVSDANVTSGSVAISCSSNLQIVKGEWLLSGTTMATTLDGSMSAVMAFSSVTSLAGAYYRVTVKATAVGTGSVKASATLKNGTSPVGTVSSSRTLSVICASHSYGAWNVTEPTCTESGVQTRTCSVCGTTQREYLPALGHSIEKSNVTKQPTCTEAGEETGTCATCGQEVTLTVPAKGHSFGVWIVTKASTCTERGEETRTCKDCGETEIREAELAPHDYGDSKEIRRDATISTPGLIAGTCVNCNEYSEQETACYYNDENNGFYFECAEGTFRVGTDITVKKYKEDAKEYENAKERLSKLAGTFALYDIKAAINGVETQPLGTVYTTIQIPEELADKNLTLIYLDPNGGYEVVATKLSNDGKTIEAELNHFSSYALCEMGGADMGGWRYIAIAEAGIILLLAILAIVLLIKGLSSAEKRAAKKAKKETAKHEKEARKAEKQAARDAKYAAELAAEEAEEAEKQAAKDAKRAANEAKKAEKEAAKLEKKQSEKETAVETVNAEATDIVEKKAEIEAK